VTSTIPSSCLTGGLYEDMSSPYYPGWTARFAVGESVQIIGDSRNTRFRVAARGPIRKLSQVPEDACDRHPNPYWRQHLMGYVLEDSRGEYLNIPYQAEPLLKAFEGGV
jgi:hypothetical protein